MPAELVAIAATADAIRTGDPAGEVACGQAQSWQPMRSFLRTFEAANHGLTLTGAGLAVLLAGQRALTDALHGAADLREAGLRAILDTAPEAILVIDGQDAIEAVNPAAEALFGYAAAEIVGKDAGLLMPVRGDGADTATWPDGQRITDVGRVTVGRRKDGGEFPLEVAVSEFPAPGCPPCFVTFVRDATEREKMEQELRRAQKLGAVGQLTGGVAHDFNNLLTVALGNLEMLEERLAGKPESVLLREAGEAIQAGAELTGRLLAVARDRSTDPQPVRLQHKVDDIAALLRRTLGALVEVRTELPDDLPPAMVDPGQLLNAVLNLAVNARDAMPRGGILVLKATAVDPHQAATGAGELPPGRYLMLSVSDTGAGMSAEERARAFDPFFTTKEAGAGTGLGLAMVHDFAKQSGGHVEIDSEPGQGTTVRLYLPRAEEPADAEPAPPALSLQDLGGRGETILVAEDDPQVRRCAVARLEDLGYRVLAAEDGPAALQVLEEQETVDLLFTDIVMPGGILGDELAEFALQQRPDLRVVLTSGSTEPERLQRGTAAGDHWLPKPYTALELARILRRALDVASND